MKSLKINGLVLILSFSAQAFGEDQASLYFRMGPSSASPAVPAPIQSSAITANAVATDRYNQMASAMSGARDALVQQQFSAQAFAKSLAVLSPDALARIQPHIEWIQAFDRKFNSGGALPLAQVFPMLARGVQKQDPFAVVLGLDDYAAALINHPNSDVLRGKLEGLLVDNQGLITGLADAPAPVILASPWASKVGMRVRGSLNRLMVAKHVFTNAAQRRCESASAAQCKTTLGDLEVFNSKYMDLALIHAMADRIGLRGSPHFEALMSSLEAVSDGYFGFAAGIYQTVEGMAQLVIHPIDSLKQVAVGLKFVFQNHKTAIALVSKALGDQWDAFLHGDARTRGEVIGRVSAELASWLIPPFGVTKATRLAMVTAFKGAITKGSGFAEEIRWMAKGGALPILAEGVEGALDTVAASGKITSMQAAGQLSAPLANEARALAKVLPRTAIDIVEDPGVVGSLAGTEAVLAKSTPTELLLGVDADSRVTRLLKREGTDALDFGKEQGIGALAGLGIVDEIVPGVLSAAQKGQQADLAGLSRFLSHAPEIATKSPAATESIKNLVASMGKLADEGTVLSDHAVGYLTVQAIGSAKGLTGEFFEGVGKSYGLYDPRMGGMKGEAIRDTLHRGIRKESGSVVEGTYKLHTQSQVFEFNLRNWTLNHRYSSPGEAAQYFIAGDAAIAKRVAAVELKRKPEKIFFQSKQYHFKNVLDLTNPENLLALGVTLEDLTSNSYKITHLLGHLARRHGFDALKVPGTITILDNKSKFTLSNYVILNPEIP